jgi:hypothetical protein
MSQTIDQNPDSLDKLIERTLARDAEQTRARYTTEPSDRLTSKLALTPATRGILSSLTAKIALFAGAAAILGTALYIIPNRHSTTNVAQPAPAIAPGSKPVTPTPPASPIYVAQNSREIASPSQPSKIVTKTAQIKPVLDSTPHPMKLDDADDKNAPKITDLHYLPPLK